MLWIVTRWQASRSPAPAPPLGPWDVAKIVLQILGAVLALAGALVGISSKLG